MKKTIKVIWYFVIAVFIVIGGIASTGFIPKAWLDKIPPWASWSILIFGILFIIIGLFVSLKGSRKKSEK